MPDSQIMDKKTDEYGIRTFHERDEGTKQRSRKDARIALILALGVAPNQPI